MYKQKDFFTSKELQLLDTIDAAASRKYRLYGECIGDDDDDDTKTGKFLEEILAMDKNLEAVMERISEQSHSIEQFVKSYPTWKMNRKKCIAKLKQIAKLLDKDRSKFNKLKLFGYCLAVAGGAGLLASGLGIEWAQSMEVASGTLTATGTGVVLGTSITETVRLARKVKKVKRLIQKDRIYSQGILVWLNHSEELQDALFHVLEIDILRGILDDIKKFVRKAMKIKDDFKRLQHIEKFVKSVLSVLGKDTEVPAAAIAMIPRIFTTVIILLCKTENRLVFDFASVTFKSVAAVVSLTENSVTAFGFASRAGFSSVQLLQLATGIVGITLDAVGIVKTCVDIHRKSRNPEAKKIIRAAMQFAEEVDFLDNLYKSLCEKNEFVGSEYANDE